MTVQPAGVSITDLTFSYEEGKEVLKGINLQVEPGERFGIIGPSGAGKSTLLLHLNGILSGEKGVVKIGDLEVGRQTVAEIRQRVGLVFQNPDDQLFNPTVEEDVAFGPLNMDLSPDEVAQRVDHALVDMNLQGFEKLSSHHLSYGERKRVALATVLAMRPAVLAFDEPFSNLSPAMVEQLIEMVRNLPATVIIVSQSILPVIASCQRLAILNEGQLIASGSAREIASDRGLLRENGLDFHFYYDMLDGLLQSPIP
ncbi:MAG: ABC transporter ATP-binding protein [Candidatus Latescibacteria bacterium]|nr:ABC transporter ATP-binding protein [Candidatus Latescibacterota bacterium]